LYICAQFLFFLWFDYSAFGLLVWAKSFEDLVRHSQCSGWRVALRDLASAPLDVLGLAIVPAQFWSAPLLAASLQLDGRTLLLARQSSKDAYVAMLLGFSLLLRHTAGWSWKRVSAVWLSGVGCGLIHHAPLCLFGMRGYVSLSSLLLTVCTEWPALLLGVAAVEQLGGAALDAGWKRAVPFLTTGSSCSSSGGGRGVRGSSVCACGLCLALGLLLAPHLAGIDDKDAMAYLIPLVPGKHMQSLGTAFLRTRTCLIPK
jgi:hypothetical protein